MDSTKINTSVTGAVPLHLVSPSSWHRSRQCLLHSLHHPQSCLHLDPHLQNPAKKSNMLVFLPIYDITAHVPSDLQCTSLPLVAAATSRSSIPGVALRVSRALRDASFAFSFLMASKSRRKNLKSTNHLVGFLGNQRHGRDG